MERAAIAGSAPDHAGYRREGAADPAIPVRVSIVLRPRNSADAAALLSGKYDSSAREAPGADAEGIAAVEAFARACGLTVEQSDAAERTVVVSGPSAAIGKAFGITMGRFVSPDGASHLSYDGEISLPANIAPRVLAVLGLDGRQVARH
jgi:kumamolisin